MCRNTESPIAKAAVDGAKVTLAGRSRGPTGSLPHETTVASETMTASTGTTNEGRAMLRAFSRDEHVAAPERVS
jgi:hypothetical protein